MNPGLPSKTALRVAMRRAAHQLLDDPLVLNDPLALRILGGHAAEGLRSDIEERGKQRDRWSMAVRAFMAVRSRLAEDELARAMTHGVRQYVVLGAGLDTFACRHQDNDLCIFEVDYPATQDWKRAQLHEAGIPVPACLTFVPVDFEHQTFGEELQKAGFDCRKPAFFSWLGVTMYLSLATVMSTLRYVASMPAGSGIVFDYGLEPSSLSFARRMAFELMARKVKSLGEPWQTFFDSAALARNLHSLNFSEVLDWSQDRLNEHYFEDRQDGLKVGGLAQIMVARV